MLEQHGMQIFLMMLSLFSALFRALVSTDMSIEDNVDAVSSNNISCFGVQEFWIR
jgi:hypothetical protein